MSDPVISCLDLLRSGVNEVKLLELQVFNMTCVGCTRMVKMTLEKFPGVKNAEVDLMPGQALISCDDGIVPADLIRFLEENTHYTALVKIR
jgi:copper chaperone CopZ